MNRRRFFQTSAGLAAFSSLALRGADVPATSATPAAKPAKRSNKIGFMWGTLRSKTAEAMSLRDKFKMLRDAGFDGVEVNSAMDQKEVLAARDAAGLEIPSVCISTHWLKPLSDPNPGTRQVGLDGLMQGLRDAKAYGATSVLLVPGAVKKDVSYSDAYTRSMAEIKKAVPLAEELGVAIAIENVWNQFLLSPLEAAAFVDAFKSPQVRWHFDVGNVVNTGFPEHWIRVLGPRIAKVHVKEFSRKLRDTTGPSSGFRCELMTGDSDWPTVMRALDDVNYKGWLIVEQYRPPEVGDAEWLHGLAQKLNQIRAC